MSEQESAEVLTTTTHFFVLCQIERLITGSRPHSPDRGILTGSTSRPGNSPPVLENIKAARNVRTDPKRNTSE
jgi:hypothetical protein